MESSNKLQYACMAAAALALVLVLVTWFRQRKTNKMLEYAISTGKLKIEVTGAAVPQPSAN